MILARRKRLNGERERGYTLMEVLVSLAVFVFLGAGLMAFLQQSISVWRLAETRGNVYERARAILDTVASDLRGMATDVQEDGAGFWIRLIADRDEQGRQRLRFVRALGGETSDIVARQGGSLLSQSRSSHYDHHNDFIEAESGLLLPPGGYHEVLYAMDSGTGTTIWRGVRAPIGGVGSLFIDENIDGFEEPEAVHLSRGTRKSQVPSEKEARTPRLEAVARPLVGDVLYLGLRFWTPTTNTWDPAYPPLRRARSGKPSGPTSYWDSTRAILDIAGASGEFEWQRKTGSLDKPLDDLFPERVEITLVLVENPEVPAITLARDVSEKDRKIPLSRVDGLPDDDASLRHVRIDDEWIHYDSLLGFELDVSSEGRGARGSEAARHAAGMRVHVGTIFRRVVEIPTYRISIEEQRKTGRRSSSSSRRDR